MDRAMRRKDKEITDPKEIEKILKREKIWRVVFIGSSVPYVVPLCYGYEDGALYLHGFGGGKKIDRIKDAPHVFFEIDCDFKLISDEAPCDWTVHYRSVIGYGRATILEDPEEKKKGLDIIVKQYAGRALPFPEKALEAVCVVKVEIESVKGRKNGYER